MFRRGLVFQSECPDRSCTRVNCHFLHPQATKSNVPDSSSLRESSWKQLHDLKQLPSTYHDSYTPAVLHDGDDAHGVILRHDDEAHVSPTHDADLLPLHEAVHEETTEPQHDHTVSAEQEQGVKRKWSQISAGEDETQHKRRHIEERSDGAIGAPSNASTLTSQPSSSTLTSQPSSSTHYSPSTTAPVPRPDVMGPRIASKKYTVDNFLGTTTTPLTALPVTTQNKSARQRINPSSQALSSDTCPIVSYTPNSHIDRAVRQKVVDRLYAHLKRVNPHEAVQQSLDLELEIYRSCQGRTSYTHQARVLFSELERK